MDLGLEGRVAMVAAASKGIGLAIAKELAAEGYRVSICARTEDVLEAAAGEVGPETRSYVVDVTDADDLAWWVAQTRQDLGPIDVLVTNTGGPPAGPVFELADDQWEAGFQSTLMNVVRLSRMVKDEMAARRWGRIVHVTSLAARDPSPTLPISSTLRSGLIALTRLQAADLAPYGVTVNAVLPGHTRTDRQLHLVRMRAQREGLSEVEATRRQESQIPMGRFAEPEEIASAAVFLCSSRASYVTGVSLLVDGGAARGL